MCLQIDNVFQCGHRGFDKFDNCKDFGSSCLGASGKHRDNPVADICRDCKNRKVTVAIVGGAGSSSEKKDPWWDGDPWRSRRRE